MKRAGSSRGRRRCGGTWTGGVRSGVRVVRADAAAEAAASPTRSARACAMRIASARVTARGKARGSRRARASARRACARRRATRGGMRSGVEARRVAPATLAASAHATGPPRAPSWRATAANPPATHAHSAKASNEARSAETRDANTHGRISAPRCAPPWMPCRASGRGRATPARSATMDATPRVNNARDSGACVDASDHAANDVVNAETNISSIARVSRPRLPARAPRRAMSSDRGVTTRSDEFRGSRHDGACCTCIEWRARFASQSTQ